MWLDSMVYQTRDYGLFSLIKAKHGTCTWSYMQIVAATI
jgi:hypothetical protein